MGFHERDAMKRERHERVWFHEGGAVKEPPVSQQVGSTILLERILV